MGIARIFNRRKGRCAFCGKIGIVTRDHVPPKAIFPAPFPEDLITVPGCSSCNHGASTRDEEFRVFLSLQLGTGTERASRLWTNHAVPTLQHNQKLLHRIVGSMREYEVRTGGGLIVGKQRGIPWEKTSTVETMEKIVRGLYFHHFNDVLSADVTVTIGLLSSIPNEFVPIMEEMALNSVGIDAFAYRYTRAGDSPKESLWIMLFYKKILIYGITELRPRMPNDLLS